MFLNDKRLVDQASAWPTRKVTGATIGSAVAAGVIVAVDQIWPGTGTALAPAITPLLTLAFGYLIRERA